MKNTAVSGADSGRNNTIIFISMVVSGIAAVLCYYFVDFGVISYLRQHPSNWRHNWAVEAFAKLGKGWLVIWLMLFWSFVVRRPRPALIGILAILVVGATVLPTKALVKRPRPRDAISQSQSSKRQVPAVLRSWSFPSGDTADVFAVTTVLWFFIKRRWLPALLTIGIAIGILRVAVFAHYPSDVCAGAGVGIFSGWLAMQIEQRYRLLDRVEPGRFNVVAVVFLILLPVFLVATAGVNGVLGLLSFYGPLVTGAYVIFKIHRRLELGKN